MTRHVELDSTDNTQETSIAMKYLSIKFIIFGYIFYSSAGVITQFLIAVPLSHLIASITNEPKASDGIFPPSIIISVLISKMFAAVAAAGYIVRTVKVLPLYHALASGLLSAVTGILINKISREQAYLEWLMALTTVGFIVIATYFLKIMKR